MSRVCQISGKKLSVGNNVPKSNKKTKRVFLPNLQKATFESKALGRKFEMNVSARAMRTIIKHGSLDEYLLHAKAKNLNIFSQIIRRKLKKAVVKQA
jgi:large subunit ribosomal protein L28